MLHTSVIIFFNKKYIGLGRILFSSFGSTFTQNRPLEFTSTTNVGINLISQQNYETVFFNKNTTD